jgi:hypothetical protein
MTAPVFSPTTQAWYNRLPESWRDLDQAQPSGGGYPLLRFLSLMGDTMDTIAALARRFAYVDPSNGGAPGPAASYHATVESDTPSCYWRFNDPAGSTGVINDVTGLTAVVSGGVTLGGPPLPPEDPSGGSGAFDGTGLVTTAYAPALSAAGTPVSLEAWIDPSAEGTAVQTILGCLSGDHGCELDIDVAGGSVTDVHFRIGTGAAITTVSTGRVLAAGAHRVLATYDGATVRLSIDGVGVVATAVAGGIPFSGQPFVIGSSYTGSLSDVAVYGAGLSVPADQAHQAAGTQSAGSTSDLVDPRRANDAWIPWLAQEVGAVITPSMPMIAARAAVETPSNGWMAGTKSAIAAAAKTVLTGSQYVGVFDHYGGDQWTIEVRTRGSETPSGVAVLAAIINAGAKPAGCALVATQYQASWSQVETGAPTWATFNGREWDYVEELGAP